MLYYRGLGCLCDINAPFRATTIGGISFDTSRNRVVNVVNRANDNGSALVRRVGNLLRPRDKYIVLGNGSV